MTGAWHQWHHPHTGEVIRQRIVAAPYDFERQPVRDRCYFECGDDREEFDMYPETAPHFTRL
ncbi:MAG: hypothetical protein O2780_20155 [Proteobacteria bacterium]|nr:hypothetical protein [Pseudomonadota bacterium]